MTALLLSDYSAALREILLPYIQDNFPKQTIALDQFKKGAGEYLMNDEFIIPLWSGRHGGVAAMAADGNNVTATGGRSTTRGTASVKTVYGAFNISKLVMDASASNTLAVESSLTAQTNSLMSDYKRQINRMIYGGGDGVVSQVRTTGGSVGVGTIAVKQIDASVDDGRAVDYYGTINGDISPTKYFGSAQIIGVGTAAAAVGTVTSVTGTSIVSGGPTAIATNAEDAIFILDGSGAGAGSAEIVGVRAALSSSTGTSTYLGVARNQTGWTPQFGSASEALTFDRMSQMHVNAQEYAETNQKYIFLVNKTLYRKYGNVLTSMRRTVNETQLLGGWTGLEFAAGGGVVGVFLDYDVPDGEVLLLNLDTWGVLQVSNMDWVSGGDGQPLLRLQNTLTYQATMVWFLNLACLAPAANAKETRKTS